ncbi:hypothetical protein [Mucilaginibacter sp. 44-25]|uniref:hypothetical protein n=1 Tax=Mucilaginibacter sp. 44-25 TaxID=1895794 RepID=UPI000969FAEB|nr:hypothetical protein [Mucilaginibacter sp. 44-25]OJW12781.1 MAG: hypothetical protein BGO48_02550 [Mucilaginibacter sp. 44-25]
MKPLQLLNNVQKARLLHSLFVDEISEFLGYLNEFTETVLTDKERIAAEWKDQLFDVGMWFELAAEVQRVMARYPKDLSKSSAVFSDQLFGGFMAIFSAHALVQYVTLAKHSDPKFKPAVDLLFG